MEQQNKIQPENTQIRLTYEKKYVRVKSTDSGVDPLKIEKGGPTMKKFLVSLLALMMLVSSA